MPAKDELTLLAIDAIKRLNEAEYATFVPIELKSPDGSSWQPRQHNCHSNVATIVNWYEGFSHVSGYLILSPRMTGVPHWTVIAHSLVQVANGALHEVTPEAGTEGVPFVRHRGSEEQLQRFREAVNVIIYPKQIS
jgi:hypothetical protein